MGSTAQFKSDRDPRILANEARYRSRHREEDRQRKREYKLKNKAKIAARRKIKESDPAIRAILREQQRKRQATSRYKMMASERNRKYRLVNGEKLKAYLTAWRKNNPGRVAVYSMTAYSKKMADPVARAAFKLQQKEYQLSVKRKVVAHYGGRCLCCGESTLEFMSIDHVNGDGARQRKEQGNRGGMAFYGWLIRNGFPQGYQVLCHNCNMAKGVNGICPHQKIVKMVSIG